MPQKPLSTSDHWRIYPMSDESFPFFWDTVAELEFRLRVQFPEVFEAARERERSRRSADALVRSSLY